MVTGTTTGNRRERFVKRPRQTSMYNRYGPWLGHDSPPARGRTEDWRKTPPQKRFHNFPVPFLLYLVLQSSVSVTADSRVLLAGQSAMQCLQMKCIGRGGGGQTQDIVRAVQMLKHTRPKVAIYFKPFGQCAIF